VECHPYHQQNDLKKRLAPYGTALESWFPLSPGDPSLLKEPAFVSLNERYGKPPVQIILRWHIQEGTIVFPRSTSAEYLKENIDIFDFALTDDEMTRIRASPAVNAASR
jgi:2,5-didehydrogluconate reductase